MSFEAAGRTIFFSSHVLSEVERVCDRVAIVRAGRLVALEDVTGAPRPPEAPCRAARPRPPAGPDPGGRRQLDLGPTMVADLPARGRCRTVPGRDRRRPVADLTIEPPISRKPSSSSTRDRHEPGGCSVAPRRAQRPSSPWSSVALSIWGSLMPVIYEAFGADPDPPRDGAVPRQFAQFGGGDMFTPARLDRARVHPPDRDHPRVVFAFGFAVKRSPASASGGRSRCSSPGRSRARLTSRCSPLRSCSCPSRWRLSPRHDRRAHRLGCAGGRPAGAAGDHVAQRRRGVRRLRRVRPGGVGLVRSADAGPRVDPWRS